jgi:hypothetical protein
MKYLQLLLAVWFCLGIVVVRGPYARPQTQYLQLGTATLSSANSGRCLTDSYLNTGMACPGTTILEPSYGGHLYYGRPFFSEMICRFDKRVAGATNLSLNLHFTDMAGTTETTTAQVAYDMSSAADGDLFIYDWQYRPAIADGIVAIEFNHVTGGTGAIADLMCMITVEYNR